MPSSTRVRSNDEPTTLMIEYSVSLSSRTRSSCAARSLRPATARSYSAYVPEVHGFARNGGLKPHCPVRAPLDRTCATPQGRGHRWLSRGDRMLSFIFAQVKSLQEAAPAESLTRDSAILGEQFYFFTVILMWLIHAGFMS